MFALDLPDVALASAPVMIVQTSQTQQSDRTIGVCYPIENSSSLRGSGVAPQGDLQNYFRLVEHKEVQVVGNAKVSVLTKPLHGEIDNDNTHQDGYSYIPTVGYMGNDKATFLVELNGQKFKLVAFFHVGASVDDDSTPDVCPKPYWRISLSSVTGASARVRGYC